MARRRSRVPRLPRVRLLGLLELTLVLGATVLLSVNLLGGADETLYAAIAALALFGALRLLPSHAQQPWRLAAVTFVLALLVGEGVVRLASDRLYGHLFTELPDSFEWVHDDVLRYAYRPGTPCADGTRRATRHRICDRPHEVPKPDGVFRIVVLGDSTSLFADDFDSLWHQELARQLAPQAPAGWSYDIVNGAVEGYSAREEVAFFERMLLRFDPDLVIVAYCLNDPYVSDVQWRSARSKLLRAGRLLAESALLISDSGFVELHADPARWATVVGAYERLARLSREHGFRVAAFVMPELSPGADWSAVYAKVEALFVETGAAVLDVHSDLTEEAKTRFRVPGDPLHPNDDFHIRVGRRTATFLQEHGLLSHPLAARH